MFAILSWYVTEEQVEDIDVSLERLISIEEDLPLTLALFLGEAPEDLSIPMLLIRDMVGKEDCCELDVVIELKVEGKMNLFTIFLIGATMQDGGKRKKSNDDDLWHHTKL